MKRIANIPASVRQKLLNKAKADARPFGELLQYYAMERFLYRLSLSDHADRFILKGAMMLRAWGTPAVRPTMDIDLLGRTDNGEELIRGQFREILAVRVADDGLVFDVNSMQMEAIAEAAEYEGLRVRFGADLAGARIRLQVDIGFGDVVSPGPELKDLPVLLDTPAPRLLCYSRESAIAEKFQAMIKLGSLNTRMKDFYDIWLLSRQYSFDRETLARAIELTFRQRETGFDDMAEVFSDAFSRTKKPLWSAFVRRLDREQVPAEFRIVVAMIAAFLEPLARTLAAGDTVCSAEWRAGGPWVPSGCGR